MIAIKNMEIPSCCGKCSFCGRFNPDEDICGADGHIVTSTLATITKNRDSRCPLIEIEQSEDCLSRKAVLECIESMSNANPSYWNKCNVVDREDLKNCITDLPSVIPAHGTCKNCNKREDCLIDTDDDFYCRDWKRRA